MIHPYAELSYAETLPGAERVLRCETLGMWILLRPIPDSDHHDAIGVYPFSSGLRPASRAAVAEELRALGIVSLVFVTDPLEDEVSWTDDFDMSRAYKLHHLMDPGAGPVRFSKHHRAEIRRAARSVVAREIFLAEYLDRFAALYDVLIARHGLGAQHRFSRAHFERLAADPARFPMIGAFVGDRLVSGHIWVRHGSVTHSHLAASDAEGYRHGAAYAVYDHAIRAFSEHGPVCLGAAPDGAGGDGLDRFKKGFANAGRQNRICGVIGDHGIYRSLPVRRSDGENKYFPRYR